MASFYDSASIITIPSGYKAGTLYSAKPTDGSGDMAFTRTGDTATRVNSAGIIERCITNSALQSETFGNASWLKGSVSITDNAANNPLNGTLTADKIVVDTTLNTHSIVQTLSIAANYYSFSIYAKADGYNFVRLRFGNNGITFNLTDGTQTDITSGYVGTAISLGSGWYRLTLSGSALLNDSIRIAVYETSTIANWTGNGTGGVLIYGAQAQTGDLATNYIPTTTAAVTEGPVTNLPRLDYFGSTCPQLLMEPTRTNLATYSQMFDNSSWSKDGVNVSGNVLVSPDGYSNADVMVEDTTSSGHRSTRTISWVSGTTYTMSCFVKQGSGTRRLGFYVLNTAFGTALFANFNIQTGVVTTTNSSIVGKIENYGNGWFRCIATATATATTSSSFYLYLRQTDAAITSAYTGDGTSSLYLWGAQVEAGAYATSYIPTTAATVTRNFDSNIKSSITSLIGQSEGTFFVDFNKISDIGGISEGPSISLNAGTNTRVLIQYSGLTGLITQIRVNATIIYNPTLTLTNQYRNKIAIAYKIGDLAVYVNGVKVGSTALTEDFTTYNLTNLSYHAGSSSINQFHARTNQVLVFKTRLTDDELATLTTL